MLEPNDGSGHPLDEEFAHRLGGTVEEELHPGETSSGSLLK